MQRTILEAQHNNGNIGVVVTNKYSQRNEQWPSQSSTGKTDATQGSPGPSYLLGIFNDYWHHPIFLEYSRITGTILSSWNIQGSLGLSCLPTTQRQNFRQCITLNQRASEKLIQSWIPINTKQHSLQYNAI